MLSDQQIQRLRAAGEPVAIAGRFEILEEAGRGGMGTVYRARDRTAGGALVALKIMSSEAHADAARFQREAEILKSVVYPRIVRYLARGTTEEKEPYLAMEWLEGVSFASYLAQVETVGWRDAVQVAMAVCEGLAAVHELGIIHRDLKPANLFLVGGLLDDVKLLDFGIARLDASSEGAPTGLTRTGELLGTAGYLAPEQARSSHTVGSRADLFSLGCVIYRAVTGTSPFQGEHVLDALSRLLTHEPPPMRALTPEIPPRLSALVRRLMNKEPEARPSSAAEVALELSRILADPDAPADAEDEATVRAVAGERVSMPGTTRREPRGPASRWMRATAGIGLLAAFAVGVAVVGLDGTVEPTSLATAPEVPEPLPREDIARRACADWATALAATQEDDGSFGVERQRASSGWATAQAMHALARARLRCGELPDVDAALDRGATALGALRVDGGASAHEVGSAAETGATAWASLAHLTLADLRGASDQRTAALGYRSALIASAAPDGGLCTVAPCGEHASSPYVTVLGAWALVRLAAHGETPDEALARRAALDWLRRGLSDPASELATVDGLAEQAAVVLHSSRGVDGVSPSDPPLYARMADALVSECELHETERGARCARSPARMGETFLDHVEGRGPNLVTFWFPWSVLLATRLSTDPDIGQERQRALIEVADAGLGRIGDGLDMLEAAPTYELAEFVVMASELAGP